jgi:hypothetical protein
MMFQNGAWWRVSTEGSGWAVCDSPRNYMTDRIIEFLEFTRDDATKNFKDPAVRGHNRDHFEYVLEALAYLRWEEFPNIVWDKVKNGDIHEPITAASFIET